MAFVMTLVTTCGHILLVVAAHVLMDDLQGTELIHVFEWLRSWLHLFQCQGDSTMAPI